LAIYLSATAKFPSEEFCGSECLIKNPSTRFARSGNKEMVPPEPVEGSCPQQLFDSPPRSTAGRGGVAQGIKKNIA